MRDKNFLSDLGCMAADALDEVRRHHFERLNDLIAAAGKRRITYKELTA
jgi:hypothetical protein